MSVARPHSATRAHSVTDEAWFSRWIAQVVNSLEQCILWNAKDITIIGIQADTGTNPATEMEWPELQRVIQQGFTTKSIKAPPEAWKLIEFRLIAVEKLAKVLKEAAGDSFVLVASCPGQHFETVTKLAGGNRNTLLCWGEAGDLANNIMSALVMQTMRKLNDPAFQQSQMQSETYFIGDLS